MAALGSIWGIFRIVSAIIGACLGIYLYGKSFRRAAGLITALFCVMVATIVAVLLLVGLQGRRSVGRGGVRGVWAGCPRRLPNGTRGGSAPGSLLRLLSAGCCAAMGLLFFLFPFPPESIPAHFAWLGAGFCAFWVNGVFLVRGAA